MNLYQYPIRLKPYNEGHNFIFPEEREPKYLKNSNWTRLFYIYKGEGAMHIAKHKFKLEQDHAYLIHPNEVPQFEQDAPMDIYWAELKFYVFSNLEYFKYTHSKRSTHIKNTKRYESYFKELINNPNTTDNYMLRAGFILLLTSPFETCHKSEGDPKNKHLIKRLTPALNYIDEFYYKQIKLSQLAKMAHLSENYFSSLFNQALDMNPTYYINQKRVEEAKHLLLTTNEKLGRIAKDVGFHDSSHLCRFFKHITGSSPGQFRNNN